jgi:hypothetical protein
MSRQSKGSKNFSKETNNILSTTQVDNKIYKRRLVLVGTITSTPAGSINTVFSMNPSAATDWTSVATLYDEFRVVGCRLRLVSRTQNTVTLGSNAVLIAFDNDDSTAYSNYAEASEYQNVHMIPSLFNNGVTYDFKFSRPSSGKETSLSWADIGTPSGSLGAVKMWADSITASTNYFTYMFEWAIEFRGQR